MTTNLCANSKEAIFTASHNGQNKTFRTPNTPINREDYVTYPFFTSQIGQNGNIPNGGSRGFSLDGQAGFKRIAQIQIFVGSGLFLLLDGVAIGSFGAFDSRGNVAGQIPLGTTGNVTVLGAFGAVVYTILVYAYAPRYGHKVTDNKGLSVYFFSNSASQPAPFSHQCIGQCSDNEIPCSNCCLSCSDTIAKIRAISSRL
jgi:hypothetical protein